MYPEKAEERRLDVLYYMERHGYINKEELDMAVNPNTTSVLVYTNMDVHHQQVMDDALAGRTYNWRDDEAQAGLSVVETHSGKVVAIAAGRNQDGGMNFNYATQTKRQIGSSAKPLFDYGPGIEFNNWSTYKLFDDAPYQYSSGQAIHDADSQYMGIMTLRHALSESRNIPALKAFQQNNNQQVLNFVKSLGISLEPESLQANWLHEAYSIGSFTGSNPWEMAAAYAAFANGGYYYEPYTINKIVFRDTGEVVTYESDKKQVMSDSTAYMITDCLKTAVNEGVSISAKVDGVNVAAKTGTTNLSAAVIYKYGYSLDAVNDAWIVGFDPEYSISMWYGYEPLSKNHWTTNDSAFTIRKTLWTATAGKIFKRNGADFAMPNSVIKVGIEKTQDVNAELKLPSEFTPQDQIAYELFKKGTEPTEVSTRYMRLPTPTNFGISYESSKKRVNLSWDRVSTTMTVDESYGELGYRIFRNGTEIAFTTSNVYSIENVEDPNGSYGVIAGYRNNRENDSVQAGKPFLDLSIYDSKLLASPSKSYKVGDNLIAADKNPSSADVEVTKRGNKVNPSVAVAITNSAGETVDGVTTDEPDTFTIKYNISFEYYAKEYTRTVKVTE